MYVLAALLLSLFGVKNAAAQDVLTLSHDGVYNTDGSKVSYDLAASSHIELTHNTKDGTDKDMYGVLSFSIPSRMATV